MLGAMSAVPATDLGPACRPASRHASPGEEPPAHAASWYAATAHPAPERPPLEGDLDVDACVVGAGFSGLSTALHLAAAGREVVLLEAARVGWGASGRNGGQVVNGLNAGLDVVERRHGADEAAFVGSLVTEGASIIRGLVAEHGIECDLKDGNLFVALDPRQMRSLEAKQVLWRRHGMDEHELLDARALRAHVGSDMYFGGMIDRSGGHLHPLNLALGEAAALERLGGRIHEGSRVARVEGIDGRRPVVHTDRGRVRAGTLVLCGNAYLGAAVPELAARVMPVSTQIVATEPLAADVAARILPTDLCVEDARWILDYYRLTPDRRLLFGGGSVYGGREPADIEAKLRPNLARVFPELAGVRIDHAWSGNFALSFTRVPQLGQLGPDSYHAMGYSGHGVTGSHLFGRLLSEAILGRRERFDRLAAMRWRPFPGGQRFGPAWSTAGSWWYGLRDRAGV